MTTKNIIETYFSSLNDEDWNTWLSLFSDNVLFDDAISGKIEGIEEMRQSAAGISDNFQKFHNRIEEIVVEGDKGMVICCIEATTKDGKSIVSTGANFYRIENEKIAYMSSFHDREPFVEAFS